MASIQCAIRIRAKSVTFCVPCQQRSLTTRQMNVLRSDIAANYKLWKTRFIWGEDSFYSHYCKSTKKSKIMYHSSERSRCYSFGLVFCLVLPRFCSRSQITTFQFDLNQLLLFSSLVSYHMTLDTSYVLFVTLVLLS